MDLMQTASIVSLSESEPSDGITQRPDLCDVLFLFCCERAMAEGPSLSSIFSFLVSIARDDSFRPDERLCALKTKSLLAGSGF